MKILYYFNPLKDKDFSVSKEVLEYLKKYNTLVFVDDEKLSKEFGYELMTKCELDEIDLVVVLGGDGTVLRYLRKYEYSKAPLFGINFGRVGALNVADLSNYKELLDKYFNGEFYNCESLTLEGTINYSNGNVDKFIVYNDVVLHRGISMKTLPIDVAINNGEYDEIYADGVCVATPTGSSAYNHSAGGPLLALDSACYVLTPICPQAKLFSSAVITEKDELHIKVNDVFDGLTVCVDGHDNYVLDDIARIDIVKSKETVNLIKFSKEISLYKVLHKLAETAFKKGE